MSRVALVTGGTRGIGAAISLALKQAGRTVVASYAGNTETAEAFAAATGIVTLKFDAGDFAACEAAVAKITIEHGPIEILVNNAGITRDRYHGTHDTRHGDAVIDTNLGSCFNLCKLTFDGMKAKNSACRQYRQYQRAGRAIWPGQLCRGQVRHSWFTKALAQEGARFGITVNAIAPGYVDTDMVRAVPEDVLAKIVARIPVGAGACEDIARGVVFLTADEGDFITGSTLSINGGQHMY